MSKWPSKRIGSCDSLEGIRGEPYLSLVIPTRNDSYPSNVPEIQGKSLAILYRQLEDARIESEILVVEYNPDPSQPRLSETLRGFLPEDDNSTSAKYVSVRVLSVDPSHHKRFRYHRERVFHQAVAINAGLRRSRGRFFVYRAADHIYSDELVAFLASKELREETIYRCDRVDVARAVFDKIAPGTPVSPICEPLAVKRFNEVPCEASWRIPVLHTQACGDFLLMSRELWTRIAGLHESRLPLFLDYDSLAMHAVFALCHSETILTPERCVYKLDHALKSADRFEQLWTPRLHQWDQKLIGIGTGWANLVRALFNYPRRHDRTFPGVSLDSVERHYVLPAFLYSHGFPFLKQNYFGWGLRGKRLPEAILARGDWDR